MDPDSLDWIWEDFNNSNPAEAIVGSFNDDDDDYGIDVGKDDDADRSSSGSSDSRTLLVRDRKTAEELYDAVNVVKRRYCKGEGDDDDDDEDDCEDVGLEPTALVDEFEGDDGRDSTVDEFYIDALEAAKTKLSEVRLVWTETLYACTANEKNVPDSYVKTMNIEKLVLLYASNFIEQFKVKYPNRRQLALVLENECGVQKCVCTFIKPSRLVYHDLDDVLSHSEFVAKHITYTKLDDPKIVPSKIASPTMVLDMQTANCFELATLLASFLIGCGYNAFVVQGYATEMVCNNDLRKVKLDLPSEIFKNEKEFESDNIEDMDEEYVVEPMVDLCSEFVMFLIEEDKNKTKVQNEVKENDSTHTSDPLYGKRVHSWVMIIPLEAGGDDGCANNTNAYFIEPSTGEREEISNENYVGIEAIWNHKNYWVNVQSLDGGCKRYNFGLTDAACWECFLPTTSDSSHNKNDSVSRCLVMPNSWVNVLEVPRNKYLMLYPTGKKLVIYMNALKESYGEYIMPDGLVEKITFYAEPDYADKAFVREIYKHRVDRLISVEIRYAGDEIETTEFFCDGRKDCIKVHVFCGDGNNIQAKRSITFYDLRYDSMIELKINENSFTTMFNDRYLISTSYIYHGQINSIRSDLLFWRMCVFQEMENNKIHIDLKRKPVSIIEKYLRDESKHKDRDVATRTFNVALNNIFVQYQYGEGQITQSSRLFQKSSISNKDEFHPQMVTENIVYPYVGHLKPHEAYLMLQEMMEAETEALRDISKLEDDVVQMLETRCRELAEFKLEISSLDWDRNHKIRKLLQTEKDKKLALTKIDNEKQMDYALPYFGNAERPFTHDTALRVRNKMINEFRQRAKHQFTRANRLFTKKQAKLKSTMNTLEAGNFPTLELKTEAKMLCSSLNYELYTLMLKMERYKETDLTRYNHFASYLNSSPDFKMLPPLQLFDL